MRTTTDEPLRTDVLRALRLLQDGKWVRATLPSVGPRRAAVQLSKYATDTIPIGMDVLGQLVAAGHIVEGRRLPGGAWRFDLTPEGRRALVGGAQSATSSDPRHGHPVGEAAGITAQVRWLVARSEAVRSYGTSLREACEAARARFPTGPGRSSRVEAH